MCLDRVMWDKIFGLGENGENWTNNAALHRFLVAKSDYLFKYYAAFEWKKSGFSVNVFYFVYIYCCF